MLEYEKAYIAGLIDGEGCITIIRQDQSKHSPKHKSPSYRLAVFIYNTNKNMMNWLQDKIDGHRFYKRAKSPQHKDLYSINISAKTAEKFLVDIQPYIIAKSEQVKLALELQNLVNTYKKYRQHNFPGEPLIQEEINKREVIYQKMRQLNQGYKWRRKDFYQSSLRNQTVPMIL